MARKPKAIPSYLLHKQSGQARVRINGRDFLLGEYGSEASRIAYGELIAKFCGGLPIDPIAPAKRGSLPQNAAEQDPGPSVSELCLAFLLHAESHYVKNGKQTSEVSVLKSVIRPLNDLYGLIPAKDFGPLALKAVRSKMVESGWCRNSINSGLNRIRRIFKFAVSNELIEPAVLQKLQAVAPLLSGRTEAHDNAPRAAVDNERIETVKALVRPLVRDLIDLQRLTGARSGELLKLTTGILNRNGDVWSAELNDHKTQHHGQSRTLHFGPQSQSILMRYLSIDPSLPLFNMTRLGYSRAVLRACDKAGIERWCPHQLRHTSADTVREKFGLEHTQAVLGHATANMAEHYAKVSKTKAAEVAREIG